MFDPPSKRSLTLLEKQPNFRDIGGIPTAGGRVVKSGLLYRSGDLSRLTREDILTLERIGIRMIIDFRSDGEVIKYPTPTVDTVCERRRIVIVDAARHAAERMMESEDAEGLRTILIHDYRRLARSHDADFREFFRLLATTQMTPLVYHCAAGKDRTGLATYLLLRLLEVADEEARRDYLLSNTLLEPVVEKVIQRVTASGKKGEILRPLMEVREEYLDAALHEIEHRYGGLEQFLDHLARPWMKPLRRKYTD